MSKYNIDNGETAIADKIKYHEQHNQAKNLNRQQTKRLLMYIIHACRELKCMSPGPKHVSKCLVWRNQWMKQRLVNCVLQNRSSIRPNLE